MKVYNLNILNSINKINSSSQTIQYRVDNKYVKRGHFSWTFRYLQIILPSLIKSVRNLIKQILLGSIGKM